MALRPLLHPPLFEAICEFRFAHTITVGAQLGDDLRRLGFSEEAQWTGNEVLIDESASPPTAQVRPQRRTQFRRPDGSMMVQVGESVLVVNHLRPYDAWLTYLAGIMRVLDAFVAHGGGGLLSRLGLRYLNRMNLVPPHTGVRDVLRIAPPFDGPFERPLRGFYQRYDFAHDTPIGMLTLQAGANADPSGPPSLVLDLDFGSPFAPGPPIIPLDPPAWLGAAHQRIEDAFVGSLNPGYLAYLQNGGAP